MNLDLLEKQYGKWLLSAYKYYVTYEETEFYDGLWDLMYYKYMENIKSFPFLQEVGMSKCSSLYYVTKTQFEDELTRLGVEI